ncbi:MAG: hypothetical protein GY853_10325 [PVC group bacterium]|nr:hypothetical protein [PVC group bacterium]
MQILKKIKQFFIPIWKNPDVSNMWTITSIEDQAKFMYFVLMNSENSDFWRIELIHNKETINFLEQFIDRKGQISLRTDTLKLIIKSLPSFNFRKDFVQQMIFNNEHCYFVGYDNLSHCWISKRLNKEEMIKGSKDFNFDFK